MKLNYQDYTKTPWGPIAAILGTLGIFFGSQFAVGILLYGVLMAAGWDTARISAWFSDNTIAQFLLNILMAICTLGLLYLFLRSRKAKPKDIGLVRPQLRDISYVLAGFAVYLVSYLIIVGIVSAIFKSLNTEQQQDLGYSATTSGTALVLVFVALVILPPVVEEIMTRGFLFSGLRTKLSFIPAAVFTSALFGLAHLGGGQGGSVIWIATIDTFTLGLVLAYLRERSGSLWPAIGLHMCKNLIAFCVLFVFK